DGAVRLWRVRTRQPIGRPLSVGGKHVVVSFSPLRRQLASADARGVHLWDLTQPHPSGVPLLGHPVAVISLAFSPSGTAIAAGGSDGAVHLWDAATRQQTQAPLSGQAGAITSVAFSPDGKTLATASDNGSVWLWDLATGQPIGSLIRANTGRVNSVA